MCGGILKPWALHTAGQLIFCFDDLIFCFALPAVTSVVTSSISIRIFVVEPLNCVSQRGIMEGGRGVKAPLKVSKELTNINDRIFSSKWLKLHLYKEACMLWMDFCDNFSTWVVLRLVYTLPYNVLVWSFGRVIVQSSDVKSVYQCHMNYHVLFPGIY